MNRRSIALIAPALIVTVARAQQLLPNPSFEEDMSQPCSVQGLMPAPWKTIAVSPDLYTFDCSAKPGGLAPSDFGNFGTLPAAHEGVRFVAGWGDPGGLTGEVFGTPLLQPLVAGHSYVVTGWFTESVTHKAAGAYELRLSDDDTLPAVSVGSLGDDTTETVWTFDVLEFTAPVGAAWVFFDPIATNSYDGADDLVLVEQPFTDLGHGLAGATGAPVLDGVGTLVSGQPLTLSLTSAKPAAAATLVIGAGQLLAPFKGGTMVPTLDLLLSGFVTTGQGAVDIQATWPAGLPVGIEFYLQWWIKDSAGPHGFSASNGLKGRANGP